MGSSVIYKKRNISLARRVWQEGQSESQLRHLYGDAASRHGVGHNLALIIGARASVLEVERALAQLVRALDHRFINEQLSEFKDQVPTLERMVLWVVDRVQELALIHVSLTDPGFQKVEWNAGELTSTRYYGVRCVHRHHNPELSQAENQALYAKCAGIHGHNYKLEVGVSGPVDNSTGVITPMGQQDQVVDEEIIQPFDKCFLNEKLGNTSGELISQAFYKRLKKSLPFFTMLRVRETEKNSFLIK